MEFVELTEGEFEGLKLRCGCENFLQSVEMYRRYRGMKREVYLVGVKDDKGKLLVAGLLMAQLWHFGKKIFRAAGGWLMDYDGENWQEILQAMTEGVREFCRQKDGVMLQISPNIVSQARDIDNKVIEGEDNRAVKAELEKLGYKYLGEYEQAKWQYVLDLGDKTPDELLMSFRVGHRQWIRRAEREGMRVRELELDELDTMKRIAAAAGERQGYKDPEIEYYRLMKEYFGDKVRYVVAEAPVAAVEARGFEVKNEKNGYVPVATAMFVRDKHELIYLYSGSLAEYQQLAGSHYIQWLAILGAMDEGYKRYNFYGVKPVAGNGVYHFKRGFKGHVRELLGTFVLPIGWLGKLYVAHLKPREFGEVK